MAVLRTTGLPTFSNILNSHWISTAVSAVAYWQTTELHWFMLRVRVLLLDVSGTRKVRLAERKLKGGPMVIQCRKHDLKVTLASICNCFSLVYDLMQNQCKKPVVMRQSYSNTLCLALHTSSYCVRLKLNHMYFHGLSTHEQRHVIGAITILVVHQRCGGFQTIYPSPGSTRMGEESAERIGWRGLVLGVMKGVHKAQSNHLVLITIKRQPGLPQRPFTAQLAARGLGGTEGTWQRDYCHVGLGIGY